MKQIASILILFLWAIPSYATTWNAASNSRADVQATIDNASTVTGDTVSVPAGGGSVTWSSTVTINKAITLQGPGPSSLTITQGTSSKLLGASANNWKVTGFTLVSGLSDRTLEISSGTGWRIYNNVFNNTTGALHYSVLVDPPNTGYPTGLIDNNTFTNGKIATNPGSTSYVNQSIQYAKFSTILGTDNTVYVENNSFTRTDGQYGAMTDAEYAGGYVYRFNTGDFENLVHARNNVNAHAGHLWEIYNNTYTPFTGSPTQRLAQFLRGGTGVSFNNIITGTWGYPWTIELNVDRNGPACAYTNAEDNTANEAGYGYPCRNQLGTGYLSRAATATGDYPEPVMMPAYLWSNTYNGSRNEPTIWSDDATLRAKQHVQKNRDVFWEGASFNGTSGVGVGTLASRPATCTKNVAYWATDEATLYKCASTDNWISYYEPYTCPHPLTGIASGCDYSAAGASGYNTAPPDSTPSNFSFTPATDVDLSTVTTTDPCATVAGIDAGQTPAITISGTGCQYNIDAGAYTANAGTVGLDNVVCMQGTSSASYSTTYPSCTLTIGGVTDSGAPWTVRTLDAVSDPVAPRMRAGSMSGGWR